MKIETLLEILDEIAPFELQEKWDNSGLLVGSKDNDVNKMYFSLDITMKIISEIPNGSTLITHHPLIFSPIKDIDFNSYNGKIIKELIKKDIDYISLHTNFDKAIMNQLFVLDVLKLGYENSDKITKINDFLISFNIDETNIQDYSKEIAKKLGLKDITYVDGQSNITKVAVCTGSGGSLLNDAINNDVDVLLTGDVTHHIAMEAKDMNISIIDISHYHSEKYFGKFLKEELEMFEDGQTVEGYIEFDENELDITLLDSENPFSKI